MAWSKKEQEKRDSKRPTEFTQEIGDSICAEIIDGKSLRTILKEEGMPHSTWFFRWLRESKEFAEQYARATEERSEAMAEDIQELADNVPSGKDDGNAIQKARLQIESRKWLMAKQKPKKYGDKIDLTSDGKALPTPIYGGQSGSSSGS